MPGDELIAKPDLTGTRAITVRAPAPRVWPWIAQLGQGRGGFYSYDFLENLADCDIHSTDRIVAGWQDITAGDEVRLHPDIPLHIVRERWAYTRLWARLLVEPAEVIDFVMTQKMLRGIRDRAEHAAA